MKYLAKTIYTVAIICAISSCSSGEKKISDSDSIQNSFKDTISNSSDSVGIGEDDVLNQTEEVRTISFDAKAVDVVAWPVKNIPKKEAINKMLADGEEYEGDPTWSKTPVKIGRLTDGRNVTIRYSGLTKLHTIAIGGKDIISSQHADFNFPYQKEGESDKKYAARLLREKALKFTARNVNYELAYNSPSFEQDLKKAFLTPSGFKSEAYTYTLREDLSRGEVQNGKYGYYRKIISAEIPVNPADKKLFLDYLVNRYLCKSNIIIERQPKTLKQLMENMQMKDIAYDEFIFKDAPSNFHQGETDYMFTYADEYIPIWRNSNYITYLCDEIMTSPAGGGGTWSCEMFTLSRKENKVLTKKDILGSDKPSEAFVKAYEKEVDKELKRRGYVEYFKNRKSSSYSTYSPHPIEKATFAKGNGVIYVSFDFYHVTDCGDDGEFYVKVPDKRR